MVIRPIEADCRASISRSSTLPVSLSKARTVTPVPLDVASCAAPADARNRAARQAMTRAIITRPFIAKTLPSLGAPGLVILPFRRLRTPDRPRRSIGQCRTGQVFLVRLFPRLLGQRTVRRRLLERMVQPAMPIGIDTACFRLAVVDHPALLAAVRLVEDVALGVLSDFFAFAPRIELCAKCLPVPPGDSAKQGIQNAHGRLLGVWFSAL